MVWNKTPKEIEDKILEALHNVNRTAGDIANEFKVHPDLVGTIGRKYLSPEFRKIRYKNLARLSKLGNKNPMFGKDGLQHHNAVEKTVKTGYITVFKPDWFTGPGCSINRMHEHQYIWCINYGQNRVPVGMVIHHIDCNKHNNSIENLQLLSISEHRLLHGQIRKVQRLSENGVGNSIPEVQSNPIG